jgi:hypothetical protein
MLTVLKVVVVAGLVGTVVAAVLASLPLALVSFVAWGGGAGVHAWIRLGRGRP